MSRRTHLKIKLATLAVEARIIRREERRALARALEPGGPNPDFEGLRRHRLQVVRPEARACGLALALLRGRPYAEVEQRTGSPPALSRIATLAGRFGAEPEEQAAWLAPARAFLKSQGFEEWQLR